MFPKLQKCRSEDLQLETPSVCGNDETLHFNILMQFCYSLQASITTICLSLVGSLLSRFMTIKMLVIVCFKDQRSPQFH